MRMRLCLEFRKSVRKLYERFYKFRKNNYYFFISEYIKGFFLV